MKTKKTIKGFNAGKYSIFFVLLFMIFISSLLNKNFLSAGNMTNVARQLAVGTILAYGEMILIISGMLDLSAGSVLALSGLLSVGFYKNTYETMGVYPALTIAFFLSVFIAVLCNLFNAVLVTNLHVPSFIATLSMQTIARGIALLYTKGQNILQIGDYKIIGQGQIWVIPIPIIILAIITITMWYTLKHTRFGRSLYAIGGNEEASIASGINVNACKYKAFIFNGVLVGIAGVLFMSRVNAGLPNGAIGYEMEGLTAAIVGGTSFSGGVGTTGGTLAGSFIIGFLNNIMNLSGVDSYVQQIVRGLLIALAVVYDVRFKSKRVNRVILVEDEEEETAKKSAI